MRKADQASVDFADPRVLLRVSAIDSTPRSLRSPRQSKLTHYRNGASVQSYPPTFTDKDTAADIRYDGEYFDARKGFHCRAGGAVGQREVDGGEALGCADERACDFHGKLCHGGTTSPVGGPGEAELRRAGSHRCQAAGESYPEV